MEGHIPFFCLFVVPSVALFSSETGIIFCILIYLFNYSSHTAKLRIHLLSLDPDSPY